MNENYAATATAAKEKARDILRAQAAIRIQDRVAAALASFNKKVRRYAKLVADFAEDAKNTTESQTERADRRAAMDAALAEVPGVSTSELAAVTADLAAERTEGDTARTEQDTSAQKAQTEALTQAAAEIDEARTELVRNQANLTKLQAGEIKVDAEELKALAAKLIEEERAEV